ncbi:hypothetical protein K7X08_031011 [Anisodus acutangulus]|uniref:Uncharacterized protein n=1 Tax=Anisodus acutangulus TaxID=402998 RepID=A0A9Q1MP97_9SOLA|nr:hypothetical protein K7X08_031011 [Anisodus acutangulus]
MDLQRVVGKLQKAKEELRQIYKHAKIVEHLPITIELLGDANDLLVEECYDLYRFSSVTKFPLYDIDFGQGKPEKKSLSSKGPVKNYFLLVDARNRDGVEVISYMNERDMSALERDEELQEFASPSSYFLIFNNYVVLTSLLAAKLLNQSFPPLISVDVGPYWEPPRKLVDEKYKTIDFPFEAVDSCDHNGPFEFKIEKVMDLDSYFTYLKSWSAYQTAKEKGVELLTDDVVDKFTSAWNEDGKSQKTVTYPIYLRIGKVGNL